MNIQGVSIDRNALIGTFLPADYSDAFAVRLDQPAPFSPDDIQVLFWTAMPPFVEQLMKLRNALVRPLGLKSGAKPLAAETEQAIRTGGSTSVMSVAAKAVDETVLWLTDRHLDCYISVRVAGCDTVVSTAVHYHNRFGRFYMTCIRPFHNIVVRRSIKKAIQTAFERQMQEK